MSWHLIEARLMTLKREWEGGGGGFGGWEKERKCCFVAKLNYNPQPMKYTLLLSLTCMNYDPQPIFIKINSWLGYSASSHPYYNKNFWCYANAFCPHNNNIIAECYLEHCYCTTINYDNNSIVGLKSLDIIPAAVPKPVAFHSRTAQSPWRTADMYMLLEESEGGLSHWQTSYQWVEMCRRRAVRCLLSGFSAPFQSWIQYIGPWTG